MDNSSQTDIRLCKVWANRKPYLSPTPLSSLNHQNLFSIHYCDWWCHTRISFGQPVRYIGSSNGNSSGDIPVFWKQRIHRLLIHGRVWSSSVILFSWKKFGSSTWGLMLGSSVIKWKRFGGRKGGMPFKLPKQQKTRSLLLGLGQAVRQGCCTY